MDDFRKELLKINKSRVHKVKNSLGIYDAYKWIRKNKWLGMSPISEHDFYAIIRTVNKALANKFLPFYHVSNSIFSINNSYYRQSIP